MSIPSSACLMLCRSTRRTTAIVTIFTARCPPRLTPNMGMLYRNTFSTGWMLPHTHIHVRGTWCLILIYDLMLCHWMDYSLCDPPIFHTSLVYLSTTLWQSLNRNKVYINWVCFSTQLWYGLTRWPLYSYYLYTDMYWFMVETLCVVA